MIPNREFKLSELSLMASSASEIDASVGKEVDVRWFGFIDDETADNSIAVQSAIDYAEANNIGCVFIPSKFIGIANAVVLKNGVSLRGIRPHFTFGSNCPDLNFTMDGGSIFIALNNAINCLVANNINDGGSKPLSNVTLTNLGFKGFEKPIRVGAVNELGFGMGGFRGIFIDGTGDDNTTVKTKIGIELYNSQQMYNYDIMMFKVRNGIKIINDKETPLCSSGNSVWEKPYVYLDPSGTSEANGNITNIVVGNVTQITVDSLHTLETSDIVQLSGITGVDGNKLNTIWKVASVINEYSFTIDAIMTGKTVTVSGTFEKGRAGIHLAARGTQPLNHVTFNSPQVNCFFSSYQNKGVCNIALTGTKTSTVGAAKLTFTDTEGKTDSHIFYDGCTNIETSSATVNEAPPLGHIHAKNIAGLLLQTNSIDTTVNFGDIRMIDGTNNITHNGYVKSYSTNSRFAEFGIVGDGFGRKNYIGGSSRHKSLYIDPDNGHIGFVLSPTDSWMPSSIMAKRASTLLTSSVTLGIERLGYHQASNSSDIVVTLPKIGTGSREVPVGIPLAINKVNIGGTVTLTPALGQTIGSQSTYVIPATTGASVFLMSGGFNDWMIVGKN